MCTVADLQKELALAQAELNMVRKDNQRKEEQIRLLSMKIESQDSWKSPVQRNLSVDVSKMEVERLSEQVEHLEAKLAEREDDLALVEQKLRQSEQLLQEEKEANKDLLALLDEQREKDQCTDGEWIDCLSMGLRTVRGEVKRLEKKNTDLWMGNLASSRKNVREKTRLEKELGEVKTEAEFFRKQVSEVQRQKREDKKNFEHLLVSMSRRIKDLRMEHRDVVADMERQMLDVTLENDYLKAHQPNEEEIPEWA